MAFLGVFRAVYDYKPQSEEELEIKEGDLLFVLEKSSEDDWWRAKKKAASDDDDEPEGLIPSNYIEEAKPSHQARALYDYTQQTDEELSFHEDARLDVYDSSDPDWTLVGCNGEYGFAPAIYIETSSNASSGTAAPTPVSAAPPMPARPTQPTDDGPIPGEADYPGPGQHSAGGASSSNPAAALAGIIAQRTGTTEAPNTAHASAAPAPAQRTLASPPLPSHPQYTPEGSEDDEAPPPSLPQRPTPPSKSPVSPPPTQFAPSRAPEPPGVLASPPYNRIVTSNGRLRDTDEPLGSPGGFHLYNIYESISHMGKSKKMPTTLGINVGKGIISITPESRNDGPSYEWTAEKLTHYSIEGKHVFVELVKPSKSVDFHAGAKDTAKEIVAQLGELAGAVRQEGLREVLAASAGTGADGLKQGQMLYEFKAQGEDEVSVAVGDEVIVLDDHASEEWWKVRRLRNGKEGVVPSSYVEITGRIERGSESVTGLNAARSMVEQNRLEEERLARDASKSGRSKDGSKSTSGVSLPARNSSLATESTRSSSRDGGRGAKDQPVKTKPNSSRVRTWTDRSGTFKVEAEFIGLKEGKIHLHKTNGVKIAVPVSKMAVEDLEYVERATGQSLDEDKPLSDIKRRSTMKAKERESRNGVSASGASVQKKDEYDWFDFFLQCGVSPQICERYANTFSKDQMGPEMLPDINEALLRTLGLKEGDILRVMKHLDTKLDRKKNVGESSSEAPNGGLFTDASGALRNNTRKGRPAPPVQTNDTIDDSAFKSKSPEPQKNAPEGSKATPLAGAPIPPAKTGFDDNAWDVKPARTRPAPTTANAAPSPTAVAPPPAPEPPKPKVNEDIALLSLSSPPLQPTSAPTAAAAPAPAISAQPTSLPPQQPQGADQAIFDKIATLAPQQTAAPRQRPLPPAQQATGGVLAPPPRAASAPGFPPQQNFGTPAPLQPHYTGFQPQTQLAPAGQSLQDLQMQQMLQQQQGLMAQNTGYPMQQQAYGGYPQQLQGQVNGTGFMPQPTGVQSLQQNYPALPPQPTGFVPQSQFGQSAFGGQLPSQQQALVNGAATGSPFADPTPRPYTPGQPSGLANSFTMQQTGYPGQQQQPSFNINQPTGANGYGAQPTQGPAPQLPPQQTGGVFGPSQPIAPLVPQKTGPAPPVRFGVQQGAKPLVPQRTGRAELSRATPQNPFGF